MHTKFLLENLKDTDNLDDLDIDWKILKQVLYKQDRKMLTGFIRFHEGLCSM
jgi:hypothetical protein